MSQPDRDLVLYTQAFPGNGEPYLENEINVLGPKFRKIYILPETPVTELVYKIPLNAEVINFRDFDKPSSHKKLFLSHLGLAFVLFFKELFHSSKKGTVIAHLREFNSYFLNSLSRSKAVGKFVTDRKLEKAIHYSFWMNTWALSLAILKHQKKIKTFVFRTNGFDLYENQTKYNYIPFRPFNFSLADRMFAVSKKGSEYMKSFKINAGKIDYSYFGTKDYGMAAFDPSQKLTLFTCSDLRRIKRVDKMVDILKHISVPVKWVHHGDRGDSENVFYDKIKELAPHVEFELHPRVKEYSELLNFIKTHHFNLFILLSETEGIPVSIIEVLSFGIPVLATDVGGVSEVVSDANGILIKKDFDVKEVAEKILSFATSNKNTIEFRNQVRKDWQERLSAENNYNKFYIELISV
jgi:glycosyltransferase involved in cell wall biosynthesis